jgi:hypothetical protein
MTGIRSRQRSYPSHEEGEIIKYFPDLELRKIWEEAGKAVHAPKGITAKEIKKHKSDYQDAAQATLENSLKIARWLESRYGRLLWYKQIWRALTT